MTDHVLAESSRPSPPRRMSTEAIVGTVPGRSRPYRRWVLHVGTVIIMGSLVLACGGKERPSQPGGTATAGVTLSPAQPGSAAAGASPGSSVPALPPRASAGSMLPSPYQPLWPFSTLGEAQAWQRSYRSGGHSPWHLSADQTALSFAQGYLGFAELNRVVTRKVTGSDARIGVGYLVEETDRTVTAAVIHLMRVGSGADAPWEVVGTDDTTFTLTTPKYGARVSSPVTVGGRITGVDESIHVQVRHPSSGSPVGQYCCLPAGGQNSRWSARVSFRAVTGKVLTIVAWTGGHIAEVERFTVTGVRP